jgi:hypothetical protein
VPPRSSSISISENLRCASLLPRTAGFAKPLGFFFARKEISMRDVAILVDGGSYLKRYKKQPDVKQVAKGLLTHCLKMIWSQVFIRLIISG